MSTSLFKRLSCLGLSPHAWKTFLYLNFIAPKLGGVIKGSGTRAPIMNWSHAIAQIERGGSLYVKRSFVFGIPHVKGSHLETRLKIEKGGRMEITDTFEMLAGSFISIMPGGRLVVHGGFINENVQITCGDVIEIGKGCAIGRDVVIRSFDGHVIDRPDYKISAPIHIGDAVWIGQGATILKGVTIGNGAVIAAGAIVTHDIPAHALAAGIPARIIRQNISWH